MTKCSHAFFGISIFVEQWRNDVLCFARTRSRLEHWKKREKKNKKILLHYFGGIAVVSVSFTLWSQTMALNQAFEKPILWYNWDNIKYNDKTNGILQDNSNHYCQLTAFNIFVETISNHLSNVSHQTTETITCVIWEIAALIN